MYGSMIRESVWFFHELVCQHGEVMIVAKDIRQGAGSNEDGATVPEAGERIGDAPLPAQRNAARE